MLHRIFIILFVLCDTLAPLSASASFTPDHSNTTSLTNGLVGYWPFDGKYTNWGTGTTQDASGNGNTGQLVNMSTTTSPVIGKIGQALKFNGSGKVVFSNPNVNSTFTFAAWIKPSNKFGTSGSGIFDTKPLSVGALRVFGHTGTPAQICWDIGGKNPNQCVGNNGYNISDWTNQWHHIVFVLQGGITTILYVDGVNVGSVSNVTGVSAPPRARPDFPRYWLSSADFGRWLHGNFHA